MQQPTIVQATRKVEQLPNRILGYSNGASNHISDERSSTVVSYILDNSYQVVKLSQRASTLQLQSNESLDSTCISATIIINITRPIRGPVARAGIRSRQCVHRPQQPKGNGPVMEIPMADLRGRVFLKGTARSYSTFKREKAMLLVYLRGHTFLATVVIDRAR